METDKTSNEKHWISLIEQLNCYTQITRGTNGRYTFNANLTAVYQLLIGPPTRLKPKQLQKNKHIPIIEVIRTSTLKLIPILLNNEKTVIHQSLRTCDGKFLKAIYNFQHGFNQFGYRDDCIYQTCSSQSWSIILATSDDAVYTPA